MHAPPLGFVSTPDAIKALESSGEKSTGAAIFGDSTKGDVKLSNLDCKFRSAWACAWNADPKLAATAVEIAKPRSK